MPETHQGPCRKFLDPLGRTRPHRRRHRREIPLQEIISIAPGLHILAQRHVSVSRVRQFLDRLAVEPVDLDQHPPEPRAEEVLPLAEQQIETAAVKLQTVGHMLHAEGHVGGLGGHTQLAEQAGQKRIGHLVVNHESGVHRNRVPSFFHHHRVGVTADPVVLFKHRDVMRPAQKMSAGKAGNAGSHNCYPLAAHAWFSRDACPAAPSSNTTRGTGRRSQISPTHDRTFSP